MYTFLQFMYKLAQIKTSNTHTLSIANNTVNPQKLEQK